MPRRSRRLNPPNRLDALSDDLFLRAFVRALSTHDDLCAHAPVRPGVEQPWDFPFRNAPRNH